MLFIINIIITITFFFFIIIMTMIIIMKVLNGCHMYMPIYASTYI